MGEGNTCYEEKNKIAKKLESDWGQGHQERPLQ